MQKFTFISKKNDPGEDESFKVLVMPSPDKNYSICVKYYKYNDLKEGEYKTSDFPNLFSDVHIYIRRNDADDYTVFEYNGYVWISRSVENNVRYDAIKNIEEITTEVQNEWEELVEYVKKAENISSNS